MAYKKMENFHIMEGTQNISSSLATVIGDLADLSSSINPPGFIGITLVDGTNKTGYSTITDAMAAATAGNIVLAGPATYQESFTIPDGVKLEGVYGPDVTVISGSAKTGKRIIMGDSCVLEGFTVYNPTDAEFAVEFSGSTASSMCLFDKVRFVGQSPNSSCLNHTGSGTALGSRISYFGGPVDTIFRADNGGQLRFCVGVIDGANSTVQHVFRIESGSSAIVHTYDIFPTSVADAIHIGSASFVGVGMEVENATRVLHIDHKDADVSIRAFRAKKNLSEVLKIEDGLASSPTVYLQGEMTRAKIDYSHEYNLIHLVYVDHTVGDSGMTVDGELVVGRAEQGRETVFGQGDSYTRGMKVYTTDATADSTNDGGNITDVSVEAASPADSTFTFQGVTANHTILLGSTLTGSATGSADVIKHWGIKSKQTTQAIEDGTANLKRSFAIEIWNGSAWIEVGSLATHSSKFYRYANELFIRANNTEHVRYGIDSSTTWEKKTINGFNLFWSRIRISTTVTQAPVFERFKIHSSRSEANEDGTMTYHGLARFRNSIVAAGNVYGESGGVLAANTPLGAGGVPTGWTHNSPNSLLNGDGDAIYFQFTLPHGIDTSFPVRFGVKYSIDANAGSDPTLIAGFYPAEVTEVLQAHPSGSNVDPVARVLEDTHALTTNAALSDSQVVSGSVTGVVFSREFGPFSVASYYEDDMVFCRLELDDDGATNCNVTVHSIEIDGAQWTLGAKL